MKERFIDKKIGIEYIKHGDCYLPNLIDTVSFRELGKHEKMRLNYLKEHKYTEYINLWSENNKEELNDTNQLEWGCRMNSIKNRVEEIFFSEIIYIKLRNTHRKICGGFLNNWGTNKLFA